MEQNIIVCDECSAEFTTDELKFNTVQTEVEGTSFEVIYYKCPSCGKAYVVCMLDYWGKKLQKKYVDAMDSYRKLYRMQGDTARLSQKQQKVEALKNEAMAYQNELLHKYGNLLPEGIFV